MVTVKFFSAGGPASGTEITGDNIIGCYGAGDTFGEQVDLGAAQDITWITSSGGEQVLAGQMNNNKWVTASTVSVNSGVAQALNTVVDSGLATLRIQVADTGNINISGAKLFAYNTSDFTVDPSGLWVISYEIIPVGRSGNGDSQWALMDATNYNYCVDRTPDVGWAASGEFNYYFGISARPKLTPSSGYHNFGLYFIFDYS